MDDLDRTIFVLLEMKKIDRAAELRDGEDLRPLQEDTPKKEPSRFAKAMWHRFLDRR